MATLANYEGVLSLNGLTNLSDAAAATLAKHEGSFPQRPDEPDGWSGGHAGQA